MGVAKEKSRGLLATKRAGRILGTYIPKSKSKQKRKRPARLAAKLSQIRERLGLSQGEMVKRLKDNPQLSLVTLPNMVAGEGALPIKVGDDVIGAAGASGAPGGEKDAACIQAGLDKIKDQLK